MRDFGVSVLEQYPVQVYNVKRVRGAVLCETDLGLLLLKEAQIQEKRLPFLIKLYSHLEENGVKRVDAILANKEGDYLSLAEDETKYVLKKWYPGKECDVHKEQEILEAIRMLARIHGTMHLPEPEMEYGKERTLREEFARHNRELRKVFQFIRGRSVKGEFERTFLTGYEQMYQCAALAEEAISDEAYQSLEEEMCKSGAVIHGEYNHHNIFMHPEGTAVTGFERAHYGLQMEDLYYFMRKILEKYQYTSQIGMKMLETYDKEQTLSVDKRKYLAVRFAYPEKFWKISNMYYHSNKAWIPEKNTEKLKKVLLQMEEQKQFLSTVFHLNL